MSAFHPIRKLDLTKPADKTRHDRMVELVEQMLAARKQLAGAQSDKGRKGFLHPRLRRPGSPD